jgi:hypothetical protein
MWEAFREAQEAAPYRRQRDAIPTERASTKAVNGENPVAREE